MMKNDDFNLLRGFADGQTDGLTDEQTDICDCRVASVTEIVLAHYEPYFIIYLQVKNHLIALQALQNNTD